MPATIVPSLSGREAQFVRTTASLMKAERQIPTSFSAITNDLDRSPHDQRTVRCSLACSTDLCRAGIGADAQDLDAGRHAYCKLNPSIGFIVAGHQSMECRYVPSDGSPPQAYEGALNTVGIDIGISAGGVLGWAVLAPTGGILAGALAGEYVGASGDLGIGVGAGANVLIGGSARTFALQPVSLEGSIAVNVALGVSGLKLRPVL